MADKQLKRSEHKKPAERPVDRPSGPDFHLFVADESEALQLNLDPETAIQVNQAVCDLLSRLPDVAGEDNYGVPGCPCQAPQRPETLPVPISQMPALSGFTDIRWHKVKQLPSYRSRPIRNLGNDIFSYFSCFRAFANEAKSRKLDGQGEILILSTITHDKSSVDRIARTIAESGAFLNSGELHFGENIPDYLPRIMLFMNKKWTFLLVQDKRENGAPVDANYIYAWPGGVKFYEPGIGANSISPHGQLIKYLI